MKDMEKAVKTSQKVVTRVRAELVDLKHKRDIIAGEVEGLQNDINSYSDQVASAEKTICRLEEEVAVYGEKVVYLILVDEWFVAYLFWFV